MGNNYWHVTSVKYNQLENNIDEKTEGDFDSFEKASIDFIKRSDNDEPVYFWFAMGEQVDILARSKAFFSEVAKEKD